MTAVCVGGTSSPRDGFAESLYMGPAAIAALLNNIPTPWAVGLAAFIGHITYNLSSFCTTDPPTLPTFTAQDGLDLLNVYNPFVNVPAAAKFQDLVGYYLWFQVCQCDSVTTPAPSAAPSAPADFPQLNPSVSPPLTESNACFTTTRTIRIADVPVVHEATDLWDLTPYLFGTPGAVVNQYTTYHPMGFVWPTGATSYRTIVHTLSGGPASLTTGGTVRAWTSTSASSFGGIDISSNGTTRTSAVRTPTGTPLYITVEWDGLPANTSLEMEITVEFFCGSQAPGISPIQPCCPPDAILDAQLQQILGLVTLIQRQLAPFAYISSTPHTGLTGSGSISVQGLIGARVHLTGVSQVQGELSGNPDVRFQAGWINWGNADGVTAREFISADDMVSFPPAAGQFTSIHYSLAVGVTATITGLVREA